jgi:leader peptidase (prepilin peptidase)/N-methyltransferase
LDFQIILYIVIFLYGIVIGSFLNVCIYRIPQGEGIVKERSHCMSCGYQLKWYDLFPVFSYIFLRGKCRKCGAHISVQYPLIEALNGILWVIVWVKLGISIDSVLICLLVSALIVLSVIDWRTYEIPFGINVVIAILGAARIIADPSDWVGHIIGMFAVSVPLLIILLASGGRAMGGGDVKLMAAAGLFLGWQNVLVALIFGCFYGSVIHIIRMRVSGEEHMLAMGPYLSAGIITALLFGKEMIEWYMGFM